jgi:hypothetical protein
MIPSIKTIQRIRGVDAEKAKAVREALQDNDIEAADEAIGGHGVEFIPAGRNSRSPAIEYVNLGDSYDTTVLRVNGTWRIGAWGDIVEKGDYE